MVCVILTSMRVLCSGSCFCLSAEECARWFSSTKLLLLCCVPGFLALLREYFALTPSFFSCPFVKWFTTVVFFRTSLSALPVSMRRLVTLLLTNSFLMLSVNPPVPAVLCRHFDTVLISFWTVLVLNILIQFVSRWDPASVSICPCPLAVDVISLSNGLLMIWLAQFEMFVLFF